MAVSAYPSAMLRSSHSRGSRYAPYGRTATRAVHLSDALRRPLSICLKLPAGDVALPGAVTNRLPACLSCLALGRLCSFHRFVSSVVTVNHEEICRWAKRLCVRG
jgi:hypothetical protein